MGNKFFSQEFQSVLWETINQIQRNSDVELVVVVRDQAAPYKEIPLYWGVLGALLAHVYLVFKAPAFSDFVAYIGPFLAFGVFWIIGKIPMVQRLCLPLAQQQHNVEIMARALFHKGGIRHTHAKTGILIYCSLLEKMTLILPDRGVELAIPSEEWQTIRTQLKNIFRHTHPEKALLKALKEIQPVFNCYLPRHTNHINELPDNLEITL
jgi:putative membrane protein